MKLETIQNLWDTDSRIDELQLGKEAIMVPQLHAKWYKIYLNERLVLKKQEHELNELRNDRYQFYDGSLDDETLSERGWLEEFRSFSKKILKSDINRYLDADKIICDATLKLAYQKEKVQFLESVLDNLKYRGNLIRTGVDWARFTNGVI